jgi:putative MATE family efflux protein
MDAPPLEKVSERLPLPAGLPQVRWLPLQVVLLAVWPFLEQLLMFLVGFVDTALAGHLSVEATSAVGVSAYVLWLMGLLNSALGVAATAILGRAAGAGRWRRARQTLSQALLLALVWGVATGGLFLVAAPWVAAFAGLRGESYGLCVTYLRLVGLAAPFSALLATASACLRGAGDTRTPFVVMLLVNAINTGMSIALVVQASLIGGHGVAGIALGTVLAWVVGCAVILLRLLGRSRRLHVELRFLKPRRRVLERIGRIAWPNLIENALHWGGNFVVIAMIGRLPDAASIGAHTIAVRMEAISYLPGLAMGVAATTLCAQYLGARQPRQARRAILWCWLLGVLVMTAMGVLFIAAPEWLARLATDQPALLERAPRLLFITGFIQAPFATYLVLSQALRGAGDTRWPMVLTFASTYLVRLPAVYLLGHVLGYGVAGVWVGLSLELTVRGMLFGARFLWGAWDSTRV